MRRLSGLSLIGRGFFFLVLMAALAFTAVRGQAEPNASAGSAAHLIGGSSKESAHTSVTDAGLNVAQLASQPESAVSTPFQITGDGQLQKWDNNEWIAVAGLPSRTTTLAVINESALYVGTEALGMFKSTDAGDTWIEVNNADLGLVPGSVLDITALAVDPQDSDHVLAATAYFFGSTQAHKVPAGLYESNDGGETWQSLTEGRLPGIVTELRLDPTTPNVLIAHWEAQGNIRLGLED